jgi:hypothetical protein
MRTENTVLPILMQGRVGVGVTGFFQRVGNKTQPPQRTIYLIYRRTKLHIYSFTDLNYLDESVIFNLCMKGLRTKL